MRAPKKFGARFIFTPIDSGSVFDHVDASD
jgi:hypothetical protein